MTRPADPKLRMFSFVVSGCRRVLPAPARRAAGHVLFAVTPRVPTVFSRGSAKGVLVGAFGYGAAVTFIFCYLVVRVWTSVVGTYDGGDPSRLYFAHDPTNQINFGLLCPIYVGLCCVLFVLACRSWTRASSDHRVVGSAHRSPRLPVGIAILIILGTSLGFTCRYIVECLDPDVYTKVQWFVRVVDAEGNRILGGLGVYYVLLMFCLLASCLVAVVALLPVVATAAEVAATLKSGGDVGTDFDGMRDSLKDFVWAYIAAKALTAALIMNVYTWKWASPHSSVNFPILLAVLVTIGVFVVSIPHYYVELAWFEHKVRIAESTGSKLPTEAEDLRPANVRLVAHVLDATIVGSFAFSVFQMLQ